jgi:hypothetical protein
MQTILDLAADVDSRYIVIACAARSFAPCRIDNERQAILTWPSSVPRGSRLGLESTHNSSLAPFAFIRAWPLLPLLPGETHQRKT